MEFDSTRIKKLCRDIRNDHEFLWTLNNSVYAVIILASTIIGSKLRTGLEEFAEERRPKIGQHNSWTDKVLDEAAKILDR